MCSILIVSLFSVSLLQPAEARQSACCEKTTSGQYCVYTALTNCAPQPYNVAPTSCEQTQYCQPVCCIVPQTGTCSKNVAAAQCAAQGGVVDATDPNCGMNQCQQGCCNVGSQYFLTTGGACTLQNGIFDPSVTNSLTCVNQGRQQEEGCCATAQNVCSYTTRGQCQGTFNNGRYCSDPSLSCGCTAQASKGCVAGEEDVYWFGSCGNKEGLAEDCDYTSGTTCQVKNGVASCASVDCAQTVAIPNNPHDPKLAVGGQRKNGERWCSYESGVGDFLDRPGSRHYLHTCINGQELVSECRQFREEICVQTIASQGLSVANCLPNEIYNSEITQNVSTVPRGQLFWDGSNEEVCKRGTTECTVAWVKKSRLDDWDCEQNCYCETQEYLDEMAKYCKAQGDCGADINIFGKQTTGGLQVEWIGTDKGPHLTQVSQSYWYNRSVYGVYGGMLGIIQVLDDILASSPTVPGTFNTDVLKIGIVSLLVLDVAAAGLILAGVAEVAAIANLLGTVTIFLPVPVVGVILLALAVLTSIVLGGGKTATKTITVTCLPWVQPPGGEDCSKCSDDPRYQQSSYANPVLCDEYRCKSLGTACTLANQGTLQAACVAANPNDPNHPIISPWKEILTPGLTLSETPDGYYIQPEVPAFTPLTFGIVTDEAAQCKIADKHTNTYEEMTSFFGGNLYVLEHNINLNLPGGQDYTYYVRCQDVQGNSNVEEYFIQFSTDKEPDLMPPIIEATSVVNGAYVPATANGTALALYLNEPSTCQWSTQDEAMQQMPPQNIFICDTTVNQNPTFYNLYSCLGALTGVQQNQATTFYIGCADLAGNEMPQNYPFTLVGTTPLTITSAAPNGELYITSPTLQAMTQGGAEQGKAVCTYQYRTYSPVTFINSNASIHTQPLLNLSIGSYTYTIDCTDAAGNMATQTIAFSVEVDDDGPQVTNLYSDSSTLYLTTNEPSSCSYSTTTPPTTKTEGTLMSGTMVLQHTLPLTSSLYHILCWDQYDNYMQPIKVYA